MMVSHAKKKKRDYKKILMRAVSLTIAGMLLLSVVFSALWQW